MKIAAAVLLFAIVCLTVSGVVWLRATGTGATLPDGADGAAVLAELERAHRPTVEIDVAARYAGRLELLDPRLALPTWHQHVRDDAARVHAATKHCPPVALAPAVTDAALAKAYAWHVATCAGAAVAPSELVDHAPFMHPSGRSYAGLGRVNASPAWVRAHAPSFHVVELAALDPATLDSVDRALAEIPVSAWEALGRGDRMVLTQASLLLADHGSLGLAKLRVFPRSVWDASMRRASIALEPRARQSICARPASPDLCWAPRTAAQRHRPVFLAWTTSSAALVVVATLALGFAYVGERRRIHSDRIHVLRTLTHELRTPATGLRLDIEPLRAAYDDLPASCQEPLLRISDGIERLHRVLHRSARYMALFETKATSASLVKQADVASVKAMLEEFADEWPEGVAVVAGSPDGPIRTDAEWLGVAVRNLVENGVRHGGAPVAVKWAIDDDELVVRVSDGGATPKLSLRRAVAPYDRDEKSPGLGLGLAIVDRVARLLGGRLVHEPSPTVFELRVPVKGDAS